MESNKLFIPGEMAGKANLDTEADLLCLYLNKLTLIWILLMFLLVLEIRKSPNKTRKKNFQLYSRELLYN